VCSEWAKQQREGETFVAVTAFHSIADPRIETRDFLPRLVASRGLQGNEVCVAVLSLIYIDRITQVKPPRALVERTTIHRMLVAAVLVSTKFLLDKLPYHFLALYAKQAGVSEKEVVRLELAFLQLLDWRLSVSVEEWNGYLSAFSRAAPGLCLEEPGWRLPPPESGVPWHFRTTPGAAPEPAGATSATWLPAFVASPALPRFQ
jgi:hypothetical protein